MVSFNYSFSLDMTEILKDFTIKIMKWIKIKLTNGKGYLNRPCRLTRYDVEPLDYNVGFPLT